MLSVGDWLGSQVDNIALRLAAAPWVRRQMSAGLAWTFNRLVLNVIETPNKILDPGPNEYRIVQLWLRNAIGRDAYQVRATCEWRRRGALPSQHNEPGYWFNVLEPGKADISTGGTIERDLRSNGAEEHLGLVVKYHADRFAYLVTPTSHQLYKQTGHWRHEHYAIPTGEWDVTIRFQAWGGYRSHCRLEVSNPGKDAILTCKSIQRKSSTAP